MLCLGVWAMFTGCLLPGLFLCTHFPTAFHGPRPNWFYITILHIYRQPWHENSLLSCSCNLQTGAKSLKKSKRSTKAHHKIHTSCSAAVASSARGKRVAGPDRQQAAARALRRRGAEIQSPWVLWRRGAARRLFVRAARAWEGEGTPRACISGRRAWSRDTLSSLRRRVLRNRSRRMLSCCSRSHLMTDVVSFLFLYPSVVPWASPPPVGVWRPAPPDTVTDPLSLWCHRCSKCGITGAMLPPSPINPCTTAVGCLLCPLLMLCCRQGAGEASFATAGSAAELSGPAPHPKRTCLHD